MQVLLDALSCEGYKTIAFADDVTIHFQHFSEYEKITRIVSSFCDSGSDACVNYKKTVLLRTMGGHEEAENAVMVNAPMGWKEVQFVSRSEILGITFGHELSSEEIWEEKMTRFELKAKIARYFSKLTPTKGAIYANVYLLPIIGFVGQFYTVPLEIEQRVRTALAKLILPQAPKVLNEQILFAPYEVGGLPIRVRDFVSEANAAIIRNLVS
jgi:hypothetical protein